MDVSREGFGKNHWPACHLELRIRYDHLGRDQRLALLGTQRTYEKAEEKSNVFSSVANRKQSTLCAYFRLCAGDRSAYLCTITDVF